MDLPKFGLKAFVITIENLPESQKAADRCIASAEKHGMHVEKFFGVTPADDPVSKARELMIPIDRFREKYSRFENCLSAFLSHHSLWVQCSTDPDKSDYLILEHDAVFNDSIKDVPFFKGLISYGAPSYGKFVTPPKLGLNKLTSKQYLPGAHAYRVRPNAAKILVNAARHWAGPTDLFLCNRNFQFIEEYYPWPISAEDSFTTIQNETGCLAKHNFNPSTYKVI